MYGTILTTGEGVEEEATTSTSLLGGKNNKWKLLNI